MTQLPIDTFIAEAVALAILGARQSAALADLLIQKGLVTAEEVEGCMNSGASAQPSTALEEWLQRYRERHLSDSLEGPHGEAETDSKTR
jgi:hypothetical protein